jgi:carboxylesterase
MKLQRVPADTGVYPNGQTIFHAGGERAILLLHGWTGWTGRLEILAGKLADAGFTVRLPRLPGHGTNVEDFQSATWKDWLRKAVDEFIELRARYPVVGVAGTSMGAILASLVAGQFGVERIALMAPAFLTRNRLLFLAPLVKGFMPTMSGDWSPEDDPDPLAKGIGLEYKSRNYTSAVAELYRIRQVGRAALPRLRSETLVIASENDEAVPPQVASYIQNRAANANVQVLMLKKSGHQMVQGVESETVCQAVVDWFAGLK